MFRAAVILLGVSAAVVVQVPSGISVAHREKRVLNPEQQESFNLDDVIHGNKKMPGMGAWSSIFQKLGSNRHIDPEALQNMLQSVGEDLEGAYVDPGLKQDLANQTIQKQIQNITADKALLTKVVQENPMVQQMTAVNPKLAALVKSPEALQRILSPEILQKVQHGGLDEDTLKSLMETPTSSKSLSSEKETQESNLGNQTNLLPKMLSSNVPAMVLESGLMLKQVKAGDGRTFPKDGDKLFVEYAGYLPNGQLFDSTNGDLYSFQLGASQVIRGWEVGLSHMSLGERAVMRVPAALAYGEAGTGPIPPNSDLFFEVELHGINSINSINASTSN